MKKLKLSQSNFAGAEVLSRAQLKKVMGGEVEGLGSGRVRCGSQDCSYTDANGITSHGRCASRGNVSTSNIAYGSFTMECFCNTSSHTSPTALGSNGGVSRCQL